MKMKKETILQLIPYLIVIISIIYTIIYNYTTTAIFIVEQYIGFGVTVMLGLLFLINKKVYKFIFLIVLILGTINFIEFTPINIVVENTITNNVTRHYFNFRFQPFSFIILILFLSINFKHLKGLLIDFLRSLTQQQNDEEYMRDEIKKWKLKYKNYSISELRQLYDDSDSLVPEAKSALHELLNKNRTK